MQRIVYYCCNFLFSFYISSFSCLTWATSPEAVENKRDLARSHMDAGLRFFQDGRFGNGLSEWSQAEKLFASVGDTTGESRALLRKGSAYLALGKYLDAVTNLQRALILGEDSNDIQLLASITSTLGNTYFILGRTEEGRQLLETSIVLAKDAGEMDIVAKTKNNLGNLYASQGWYRKAMKAYRECLSIADAFRLETLAAKASVNLARTMLISGDKGEANLVLENARVKTQKLARSHDKSYMLISIGKLYGRLEEKTAAERSTNQIIATEIFEDAIDVSKSIDNQRALSYGLGYLGQLYEDEERYQEALRLTQLAVQAAQSIGAAESLYQWEWQTGRLLRAEGDSEGAIAAYQRAIYGLQSIRTDLTTFNRADRGSFRQTFGPIYLEYADLLLSHTNTTTDPVQVEDYLREVRGTIELLKGAELEDYFQDDCVTALKEKTRGIDRLDSKTAAIYPIILEDRLELLLSLPREMVRVVIQVSSDVLLREVRVFRRRLEKRSTHQYMSHARKLYDWIIRPLEPTLQQNGIDTLVIVPDGALRTIPMAALHDGKEFLISRYAIATTPGLTLTDPRPLAREQSTVLLGGLTESVQGFPALPNVKQELEQIQILFGGKLLQDQDFVITNMESELTRTPYSIVHVASHGQFDKDVDNTFLLTYDGKLSMGALEQYLGISKYRKEPVELLTLSACQTAAGDDRAALGLAGIAIKAGARSALATLWFISDRASTLLISDFYQQLQNPAVSKAEALQRSQLSLLRDRRYRHPAYWSPFLLIGNWL